MATAANITEGAVVALEPREISQGVSNTQRAFRRLLKHRMALFGAGVVALVLLYVLIGSFLYSEKQANFVDTAKIFHPPSVDHPFGTDDVGRDILARTIYGGQISLFIGVTAVFVQMLVGVLVGIIAGYVGGIVDTLLMRFAEMLLSIPQLFLAALAVKSFSDKLPSNFTIGDREFSGTMVILIFVIGLTSWMRISRIVRATVLSIREQDYITAAQSIGVPTWRIAFGHILPNCMAPIIVAATLGVANAILLEAYLSFLGLGVRAPTATWGNMVQGAVDRIVQWYFWLFPMILIMLVVMGINFFGDGLRDALDPRNTK